jgi:dolichyl-phosphate beta-glucosyltransferase
MQVPTHLSEPQGGFQCTLVLPTYNAVGFIESTVDRLNAFLERHGNWCAIFVCDGCTDGTSEKLAELVSGLGPRIRVVSCDVNRGKGSVLRDGLNLCDTQYLVYTDVDFAYDPEEAIQIVEALKAGADIAVANRASAQSEFLISPRHFSSIYRRHILSRCFNWWLRRVLPISICDTQAGLKGMTFRAWKMLVPRMTSDGFFFDVELLARGAAAGLRIEEMPVCFKHVNHSTVRMMSHGWQMVRETVKLRHNLHAASRSPVTVTVSREVHDAVRAVSPP